MNACLSQIEIIRETGADIWSYQMIPMLSHIREQASEWLRDPAFLNATDEQLMQRSIQLANDQTLRYSKQDGQVFQAALKGVLYEQLIPTLLQKSRDGEIPPVVKDLMEFYNAYLPDGQKYEDIEAFLNGKKDVLEAIHLKLQKKNPIEKNQFVLPEAKATEYLSKYKAFKTENPEASDLDFAKLIVIENLNRKAEIESAYNENGSLFFNPSRCQQDSQTISTLLEECRHAGEITAQVKTRSLDGGQLLKRWRTSRDI